MNLSKAFDETLPIDDVRGEFDSVLTDDDRPVVVVAPTGSGKSTRLPLWLGDRHDGTVLVVEPRRVACRSLATYLAETIGEDPGETIGYRVRFDDTTSHDTRVMFVTTGVALNMLAEDGPAPFDSVLLDEFHERGWEIDLIAAVMVDALDNGDWNGDLVLTSATVDAADIASTISADVVEARGRTYPVDVTYRGGVTTPSSEGLANRVRDAVVEALETDDGDILVFLPGKGEISECESALSSLDDGDDVEVLGVHGRLPPRYLARAFSGQNHRRIFLSTNVAETSLTLPGVTTVVDSGLVRMKLHRGGHSALALVPISEDSMDQRAGRAGRVRPGRCIRLWSRRFQPDEETDPEIERIELDDVVLQAAHCGLEGDKFDQATWLTQPPEFAVEEARRRLRRIGALDEDNRLTDNGDRMGDLPVRGEEARILLDPPDDLAATAADLVALLQIGRDLLLSRRLVDRPFHEIKSARTDLLDGLHNEVYVQLTALRHGRPGPHGLHKGRLREARRTASSLRRQLGVEPADPTDASGGLPDRRRFSEYLLDRVPESAFVVRSRALDKRRDGRARRGQPEPWANGDIELKIWPFEPPVVDRHPDRDPPDDPVAGLVLDSFWLGDEGIGVRGTGRMVLPCSYNQLLDAGIGDEEIGDVRVHNSGGIPRIRGVVERNHAGITLDRQETELTGEPLLEAAADAILDGQILGDAGRRVLDDLHVWDIMAKWPSRDRERRWDGDEPPPPPRDYLVERLETMGVETDEDLMLVEPEDLCPDITDEVGAYQMDVDSIAEDFPRVWKRRTRRYHCDVQPTSRKVVMTPLDKKTSRHGEPEERVLPRFRAFKVIYRNDSRVVPIRSK